MNARHKPPTWQQCFDAGMTAPEAAQARGVGRSSAYSWSSRKKLQWPKIPSKMRCPIRIRGVEYASMDEASKALGIHQSVISRHLDRHGHAENAGKNRPGGQPGRAVAHLSNPVTIGKRTWPSRRALADDIGWTQHRVVRALGKTGSLAMRDNLLVAIMLSETVLK